MRTPPQAGSPRPRLPSNPEEWQPTHEDIERALEISSDTAPGPDGIPYEAWRALGGLSVEVLTNVAAALADVDASKILQEAYVGENDKDEHEYNFSTLICFPKKISGEDPTAGVYYTPENTRPLSIVNTDNRLVANAARLRWESLLKTWVLLWTLHVVKSSLFGHNGYAHCAQRREWRHGTI